MVLPVFRLKPAPVLRAAEQAVMVLPMPSAYPLPVLKVEEQWLKVPPVSGIMGYDG